MFFFYFQKNLWWLIPFGISCNFVNVTYSMIHSMFLQFVNFMCSYCVCVLNCAHTKYARALNFLMTTKSDDLHAVCIVIIFLFFSFFSSFFGLSFKPSLVILLIRLVNQKSISWIVCFYFFFLFFWSIQIYI